MENLIGEDRGFIVKKPDQDGDNLLVLTNEYNLAQDEVLEIRGNILGKILEQKLRGNKEVQKRLLASFEANNGQITDLDLFLIKSITELSNIPFDVADFAVAVMLAQNNRISTNGRPI